MSDLRIPVACVQAQAHDRESFASAWPHILALLEDAARHARLVVLPEGTVPAYVLGGEPVDEEQVAGARADVARIARAHGATIVYGSARVSDGRAYNSACVIGPDGSELGHTDKHFLWHFDRRWFAPGAAIEPIETPLGTLGVMICADGRIPTIAARLASRGAQALVMPTAWVTSMRDPATLENIQADLFAAVRARENGLPFIAANKVGVEARSVAYCGKSQIVDALGHTLARASQTQVEVLFGEIELGAAREHRAAWRVVAGEKAQPRRVRIAFTPASDDAEIDALAKLAHLADADVLVAARGLSTNAQVLRSDSPPHGARETHAALHQVAGLAVGRVDSALFENPAGLVSAREASVDCFVWDADVDPQWQVPLARTRAAELRAYVVVIDARPGGRAFACDPDGAVIAGTAGDYRMGAFTYDGARTAATAVAPFTDVLEGLRRVESLAASENPALIAGAMQGT